MTSVSATCFKIEPTCLAARTVRRVDFIELLSLAELYGVDISFFHPCEFPEALR